jgi:hypothetical protein
MNINIASSFGAEVSFYCHKRCDLFVRFTHRHSFIALTLGCKVSFHWQAHRHCSLCLHFSNRKSQVLSHSVMHILTISINKRAICHTVPMIKCFPSCIRRRYTRNKCCKYGNLNQTFRQVLSYRRIQLSSLYSCFQTADMLRDYIQILSKRLNIYKSNTSHLTENAKPKPLSTCQ